MKKVNAGKKKLPRAIESTDLPCSLGMRDLRLEVRLGWGEAERATPQTVGLNFEMHWRNTPTSVTDDELAGTIDYDQLVNALRAEAQSREFRLIEYLAGELLNVAIATLAKMHPLQAFAQVELEIHKLKPPVKAPMAEAIFRCGKSFALPARRGARGR